MADGVKSDSDQLPLFSEGPALTDSRAVSRRGRGRESAFAERVERERAEAAAIAVRIPPNVRFGTSSWSFPGWAGLVYSRRATASELAREGLIA